MFRFSLHRAEYDTPDSINIEIDWTSLPYLKRVRPCFCNWNYLINILKKEKKKKKQKQNKRNAATRCD